MSHLIVYIYLLLLYSQTHASLCLILFSTKANIFYIHAGKHITTFHVGANLNICNQNNPHPSQNYNNDHKIVYR